MPNQTLPNALYTIAWICALRVERVAAEALLDSEYGVSDIHPQDTNNYTLGKIGRHNVVIVSLPLGGYGTINAAVVANNIKLSFPSIQFYLMVGIGGGIPSRTNDIRLGDIVVGTGVIQYDLGKTVRGGKFQTSVFPIQPPRQLRNAMARLEAGHELRGDNGKLFEDSFIEVFNKYPALLEKYRYQGQENDVLYEPDYHHEAEGDTCEACLTSKMIDRLKRNSIYPNIHHGYIASGDQVIKDAITRDQKGRDFGAICFEMEAAGLADLPSLTIRGICDYSDSHKNKRWQPYAALTAAIYTKELLEIIKPLELAPSFDRPKSGMHIFDIPRILHPRFSGRQKYLAQISGIFDAQSSTGEGVIVSVFGVPGVGKSQLCLKYATDNRNRYRYTFYAIANTIQQWRNDCNNILRSLGIPIGEVNDQNDKSHLLKRWLSSNSNWVIIIDDVTLEVVSLLRETLPQQLGGDILLSTKDRYIAEELCNPECCLRVQEMDSTEGAELFRNIYNHKNDREISELTASVREELGGLPLILEQVVTCGKRCRWEASELLHILKQTKTVFKEFGQNDSAVTNLAMSLRELTPAHITLLQFMAMMHPQALPVSFIEDGAFNVDFLERPELSAPQTEQECIRTQRYTIFKRLKEIIVSPITLAAALSILERSQLIQRGESGEIFVNNLTQDAFQQRLRRWERVDLLQYANEVLNYFTLDNPEDFNKYTPYLPAAKEVARQVQVYDPHHPYTFCALEKLGIYYAHHHKHEEAKIWYSLAYPIVDLALESSDESRFFFSTRLGVTHFNLDEYDEAIAQLNRAYIGFGGSSSEPTPDLILTTHYLAATYSNAGRYSEALPLAKEAYNGYEQTSGIDHADAVEIATVVGLSLYETGVFEESLQWLKTKVLVYQEQILGPAHEDTLKVMGTIGNCLKELQQYTEASEYLSRALTGLEQILDPDNVDILEACNNLGYCLGSLGRFSEALEYYTRAHKIYKSQSKNSSIKVAPESIPTAALNIARVLERLEGKQAEAVQWYEYAAAMFEHLLGQGHEEAVRARNCGEAVKQAMSWNIYNSQWNQNHLLNQGQQLIEKKLRKFILR